MISAFLALGASLCWGVSDYVAGHLSRSVSIVRVLVIAQIAGLAFIGAVWLATRPDASGVVWPYAIAAGAASLVALGFLYAAMTVGKISVVAPIASSGAVIPVLFGLLHGNNLSFVQAVGVVAILLGVPLASRSAGEETGAKSGALLAVLAGVSTGAWFILMDEASTKSPLSAAFVMRLSSTALIVAVALIARQFRPGSRKGDTPTSPVYVGTMALVGVSDAAAEVLFTAASAGGILSIVGPLSSLYPVVTVILAICVIRERVLPVQWCGAVLALAGSVLVAS